MLSGSAQSDPIVAVAAIHRTICTGLKWHLGGLSTLGAYYRKQMTLGCVAIIIIPIVVAIVPVLPSFSLLAA